MDKLILMHGPNGSAKSSLVRCLHKGLEAYSHSDDGAVYRFNWIFPEEKFTRTEGIGFGTDHANAIESNESYAHIPEERIAARVTCPLRDNPLFLLPLQERMELFEKLRADKLDFAVHELSETMQKGGLSPMNQQIFEALMSAYAGDYSKVLQHIQVERYYFSERYKVGAVTIDPQMSVDARIHQLTADRSLSNLPPVLQTLSIYEPGGHLVQANHGVVEYSDLLKRPVDAYKYLLGTCETGRINLDVALIYLDLVMIGSSNDKYLEGFKQIPDYQSFKGRMEFVRVPYLRNFHYEKAIYDEQLMLDTDGKKLIPHMTEIVSLWTVLTRLRRPNPALYPEQIRGVIERMNPLEKAIFYADGEAPEWTTVMQSKELHQVRELMLNEHNGHPRYEGSYGASPREGKMILQAAVQNDRDGVVNMQKVFHEIQAIISNPSVYEWLQLDNEGDYGDQERLLGYLKEYYILKVDSEIKVAMEMIEESQYLDLLERYVENASAWIQRKKVVDPVSGQEKAVDENFLREVESIIAPSEEALNFRQDVVSRVGAYALDNPDTPVAYTKIFSSQLKRMQKHYFSRQQARIGRLNENLLKYLGDRRKELTSEDEREVKGVLERMQRRFAYVPECTRDVVALLMRTRYSNAAEPYSPLSDESRLSNEVDTNDPSI
jgi:predicted Ser/Thr protein kinase